MLIDYSDEAQKNAQEWRLHQQYHDRNRRIETRCPHKNPIPVTMNGNRILFYDMLAMEMNEDRRKMGKLSRRSGVTYRLILLPSPYLDSVLFTSSPA